MKIKKVLSNKEIKEYHKAGNKVYCRKIGTKRWLISHMPNYFDGVEYAIEIEVDEDIEPDTAGGF